ncbi:MAG: TRAP transporter small permease subunit [Gammaproteobacteria bacterium]
MRWIDRASVFIGESVSFFYLIAVFVTVYEVLMRYALNSPTDWAHELTIVLCALGYLLSGGYVTQKGTHIRITALYELLPARARSALDVFALAFGALVMGLLTYASWDQSVEALRVWERTGSAWDPPMYAIVKPAITLGAALFCVQCVANLVRHLRRPALPGAHDR